MNTFVIYEGSKPWSFGSHAMFSYDDYWFFQRMLECTKCKIRRLYQKFAAKELSTQKTDGLIIASSEPRRHFHRITRILRAINTIDMRIKAAKSPLERHKFRSIICEDHLFDAFDYMFQAADDNIYHLRIPGIGSSPPAKWVDKIFPRGQTMLYHSGLSEFQRVSYIKIPRDIMSSLLEVPMKEQSKTIRRANRRWLKSYGDLDGIKVRKEGKRVRFAEAGSLVQERLFIRYASAAQLLREDKTWILESIARRRIGSLEEEEYRILSRINRRRIFRTSNLLAVGDEINEKDEIFHEVYSNNEKEACDNDSISEEKKKDGNSRTEGATSNDGSTGEQRRRRSRFRKKISDCECESADYDC